MRFAVALKLGRPRCAFDIEVHRTQPRLPWNDAGPHDPTLEALRKGAHEIDEVPAIVFGKYRAEAGHAALGNPVAQPPIHVPGRVQRRVRLAQIGGRHRQRCGQRTVAQTSGAVTGRAVLHEQLAPVCNGLSQIRYLRAAKRVGISRHRKCPGEHAERRDDQHGGRDAQRC